MLHPALRLWPVRRIGIVSYGIYLYHHLVRHVVDKGIGHFGPISKIAFTVVLSLATWAFAEASFRFYEMRFLALKARLTK